jgi:hypothetical protein
MKVVRKLHRNSEEDHHYQDRSIPAALASTLSTAVSDEARLPEDAPVDGPCRPAAISPISASVSVDALGELQCVGLRLLLNGDDHGRAARWHGPPHPAWQRRFRSCTSATSPISTGVRIAYGQVTTVVAMSDNVRYTRPVPRIRYSCPAFHEHAAGGVHVRASVPRATTIRPVLTSYAAQPRRGSTSTWYCLHLAARSG